MESLWIEKSNTFLCGLYWYTGVYTSRRFDDMGMNSVHYFLYFKFFFPLFGLIQLMR